MSVETQIIVQSDKRIVRIDIREPFVKMYIKNESTLILEMPFHNFMALYAQCEIAAREIVNIMHPGTIES